MSAAHRVFAVTELQEEILLNLSLNELLRTLQVCRAWARSTRRIRQALYLEPTNRLLDLDRNRWKLHIDSPPQEDMGMQIDDNELLMLDENIDMETDEDDSEYEDENKETDDDEPLEYEASSSRDDDEATPNTIDPQRGPVLNPFINAFLNLDGGNGPKLRSLGIVTFPSSEDDDTYGGAGAVEFPDHLVWKLACSVEAFRNPNASWRRMQVMQPAVTEIRTSCRGYEVDFNQEGKPVDFQYVDDEDGEPQAIKLSTFDQDFWVQNPTGVTLGQWVDLYQRHHASCPHCVYMVDEFDEDYDIGEATLDCWMYDASHVTRKLAPDIPGGRETFVKDDNDSYLDQLVVPGSGFSAQYVLSSFEGTLRPAKIPDAVEAGEEAGGAM